MRPFRCWRRGVVGIGALVTACLAGTWGAAAEPEPERNLSYSAVARQDRAQQQLLTTARENFARGEVLAGLADLQQVLDADAGSVVPRDGALVSLQDEADRLLGTLPPQHREAYERLYGDTARKAVERAERTGNVAALREVVTRYRRTQAGREAMRSLAAREFDAGRFSTAAAALAESVRGRDANDPAAVAAMVVAWLRAGERPRAETWLAEHRQQIDGRPVVVGGRTVDLGAWLRDQLAEMPPAGSAGVSPAPRAAVSAALPGIPAQQAAWQRETGPAGPLMELVGPLLDDLRRRGIATLPRFRPVAAGGLVVARTLEELCAVEAATGQVRWRRPLDSFARKLGTDSERLLNSAFASMMATALAHQMLADGRSAALAHDGRRLYALVPAAAREAEVVEPIRPPATHRLAAFELATGEVAWQIGPEGTAEELDDVQFLGVPTPHEGTLYALGLRGQWIELIALHPESGHPSWRLPLAEIGDPSGHSGRRGQHCPVVARDGLLFCSTGAGAVVCIDVLRRSIRWAWRYPRSDVRFSSENPRWVMGGPQPPWWDGWRDVALHVAGERVVFAAPDTNSLHVLDRQTGRPLWQQTRGDGLYIAGVQADRIGIIAADGLRAVTLSDGRPVWHARAGRPAGQGILTADRYLLPLAEGGVAAIAWADGHMERTFPAATNLLASGGRQPPESEASPEDPARVHSTVAVTQGADAPRSPMALGNLILADGHVLSQSQDQLALHPALTEARAALDKSDTDTAAHPLRQARLAREAGDFTAAQRWLDQALKDDDTPETQALLRDTLLTALRWDLERTDHWAERLDGLLDSAESRAVFLMTLAGAHRRAGRPVAAAEALLRLLDLGPTGELTADTLPPRHVRIDRYVQGQLLDLLAEVGCVKRTPDAGQVPVAGKGALHAPYPEDARAEIDAVIARRLEQARGNPDPFARQRALRQLDHLPGVMRAIAREPQAVALGQSGLQAELMLREIAALAGSGSVGAALCGGPPNASHGIDSVEATAGRHRRRPLQAKNHATSPDPVLAATALRQLAEQFVARRETADAAAVYRQLSDRYADVRLDDGQTVDAVLQSLDPQTVLAAAVARGPLDPWPAGPPMVTTEEKRSVPPYLSPLPKTAEPGSLFDRLEVWLEAERGHVRFQGDGEPGAWSLEIPRSQSPFRIYPPMRRAWGVGSLLVLQYGSDLYGIAPFNERGEPEARLLWHLDMEPESAANMERTTVLRAAAPRGFGLGRDYPVDDFEQTFAWVGPVGPGCVCYQYGGELIALEPTTGNRLWQRSGLPPLCLTSGDAEVVVLYRTDSYDVEVLRTLDGRTLATHRLDMLPAAFLDQSGRHALCQAERPGGVALRQIDLSTNMPVWEEMFPAGTIPFGLDETTCGVIAPDGTTHLLSRADGRLLARHRLDRPATLEEIWCAADARAWYVAFSEPTHGGNAEEALVQGNFRRPAIRGLLCAFDRRTGKLGWSQHIERAAFPLEQPADAPLLTLLYTETPLPGIEGESKDVLRCLDKRTGETLTTLNGPNGILRFAVECDPPQRRAAVITPTQTVRFQYGK